MSEIIVNVHNLSKRFGNVVAVDQISFNLARGSTVGLLGGNGAGKTSTLGMLLGLLLPSSGEIKIFWRGYYPSSAQSASLDEFFFTVCRFAAPPDSS